MASSCLGDDFQLLGLVYTEYLLVLLDPHLSATSQQDS